MASFGGPEFHGPERYGPACRFWTAQGAPGVRKFKYTQIALRH